MGVRSLAFVVLTCGVAHAQEPTLRQLAIEHQGQVSQIEIGCGWFGAPLAGIVEGTDLVIDGIVLKKRTYATPDDRDIYTEYEFDTKQVILQRILLSSLLPGPAPPMIFKTRGGTVVFDGYPFTLTVESNSRSGQLKDGDHVVIFGKYDKRDGKWLFTPRDVFDVSDDVVINTLPSFDDHPEGLQPRMPIRVFADKVREVAKRGR